MRYITQMQIDMGQLRPHKRGRDRYCIRGCPSPYPVVTPRGTATWIMKPRIGGKLTTRTLGRLAAMPKIADVAKLALMVEEDARLANGQAGGFAGPS
jgi:hypothetical protein